MLKEISNIVKTDADNLSAGIARVIKESSGQAYYLIIDLSKQVGASLEGAKRGVARYFGHGSSKETIRIVGQGFDETFHKTDVIKEKK